ncbi:MAG: Mrp/NBP35 family ATP-binding protein [Dehalococcoidia bacterium]|nr:Mrp/NBP35 family ATP-binding protein [Dehalococcoidia bacterium]MCB9484321.1 Mrp/NBP35 family ATP-binding protein [Dehalococcoidia bacterium]
MVEQAAVLTALKTVNDPELHRDIVSLNMVRNLAVDGERVAMELVLTTPACPLRETIDKDVRTALAPLGVTEIEIDWGAEVRSTMREGGPKPIEGVRNVIAVASNKGGVGKSTVSVNLAVTLAKLGASVGLLDADITGPNIPTMLGIEGGILASGEQGLKALDAHGIKAVSLGFVLPPGTPVVWRGPMIGSGVRQLMHDVDWGDLDYLIVDLPPGTSDASMSMAQEALIAGAVVVSTPSKVSIEDASKAVSMFDRLGVPIFGVVENMTSDIFGRGGAREAAESLGVEFLGEIPLSAAVRQGGDEGVPVVIAEPESEQTQAFIHLAEQVAARCSVLQFAGEAGVL